jgi:hypothetical protein
MARKLNFVNLKLQTCWGNSQLYVKYLFWTGDQLKKIGKACITYRNYFLLPKTVALCMLTVVDISLLQPLACVHVPREDSSQVVGQSEILVGFWALDSQAKVTGPG